MTVTQMLRERIMENLKCLKEMKKDSPEYKQLVDDTMKMVDRYNTLVRANAENKSKKSDAKHEILIEGIKNGTIIFTAVLSAGLAVWGTKRTFAFEIDYSPTPTLGREYFKKLLSKK